MQRTPEPEVMDAREDQAYAEGDFREVNWRVAKKAARLVEHTASGRALDVGCGPAEIPINLCRLLPSWKVVAVDLSASMLRAARNRVAASGLRSRIDLVKDDATRLKRVRGRFELVLSNSLLHHLPDPQLFWKKVPRVLRPGGAVLVQDLCRPPTRTAARGLVRRHAGDSPPLLRRLFYQSLLAAFEPSEVRRQLADAGLYGLVVRKISDRHLAVRGFLKE